MNEIKIISCPNCGTTMTTTAALGPASLQCKKCKQSITVDTGKDYVILSNTSLEKYIQTR